MTGVNNLFFFFSSRYFLQEIENMFSVFLSSFSINLQVIYHECRFLIGYATRYHNQYHEKKKGNLQTIKKIEFLVFKYR